MYEFETFGYLAPQKTGSTFIIDFLSRYSKERRLSAGKHSPANRKYDPKKFYFISVRNPLDQYISLYSYGIGGQGVLYARMRKQGYDILYDGTPDGFKFWLKFVLQPANAALLDPKYARSGLPEILGYQSYRYLKLAVPAAEQLLRSCKDEAAVRDLFQKQSIVQFAIRNERLNADLAELARTRLRASLKDPEEAIAYLEHARRINASKRIDAYGENVDLGKKAIRRLQAREWLLHELFGY